MSVFVKDEVEPDMREIEDEHSKLVGLRKKYAEQLAHVRHLQERIRRLRREVKDWKARFADECYAAREIPNLQRRLKIAETNMEAERFIASECRALAKLHERIANLWFEHAVRRVGEDRATEVRLALEEAARTYGGYPW